MQYGCIQYATKWCNDWKMKRLDFKTFNTFETNGDSPNVVEGQLLGQIIPKKFLGTRFELFYLMFVDDGAFLFASKEELQRGANHIFHHFKRFGLKMHIGRDNQTSKTEVVFYGTTKAATTAHSSNGERIPVTDGYITTTKEFKYLGSWITDDLDDTTEIKWRIQKAKAQIGLLYFFFKADDEVPRYTKYLIFMAIPMNTVHWGYASYGRYQPRRNAY